MVWFIIPWHLPVVQECCSFRIGIIQALVAPMSGGCCPALNGASSAGLGAQQAPSAATGGCV